MALIKCPECKKKISNTIKTCPNCGYELKEEDRKVKKKETNSKNHYIMYFADFYSGFCCLGISGITGSC